MKIRLSVLKVSCCLLLLLVLLVGCSRGTSSANVVEVYAAASTQQAVEKVAELFTQSHGVTVRVNSASSSTLARQIEAGANAEVFLSANEQWMDFLEEKGRLQSGSRTNLLGNRLVLIDFSGAELVYNSGDIAAILSPYIGPLAIGDPAHVPAGVYAKSALESLGLWERFEGQVVAGSNVRAALNFVATGEAQFGIVYSTEARITDKVTVLAVFPEELCPPIRYPVALIEGAGREAESFIAFLHAPEAQAVFEQAGFKTDDKVSP